MERRQGKKTNDYKIQNWLIALLFIFALSVIGLGISFFVGVFIPFWILFIFSLIYSIEKWFYYRTRKHKSIGKVYRLFLNITILYLLGLIIWSGIKLFISQFTHSPLAGSLIFLAEFVFFIWIWRVVAKNSWRWPSMKLTAFSLICLFLILAFAGVHPMSSYKDDVISKLNTYWTEQKVKNEEKLAQAKLEEQKRLEEQKIAEQKRIEEQRIAEQKAIEAQKIEENKIKEEQEKELQAKLLNMEHEVLLLVNLIRSDRGIQMLQWDDKLYTYSKSHSEEMAKVNEMFHTDMNKSYAENCWMGSGNRWEAIDIVESWMSSPKHRTWLLCPNLKRVAVGIVYSGSSTFASWTFWRSETTHSDWWYQYTPDNPPKWWY